MYTLAAISIGFILDLLLGDPHSFPHPVRLIGRLIGWLDQGLQKHMKKHLRLGGFFLVLLVLLPSVSVPVLLLMAAYRLHPAAGVLLEGIFCYQLLAARCLEVESRKVYLALKEGDMQKARKAVSMIVGRDTDRLSAEGIAKAAVETVAENTSDGEIAPLFYLFLFGAAGGFFYKAVNTMDSMVGYKNETYREFGTCAARLDDILNFIPSRIAALLMILSAFVCEAGEAAAERLGRTRRKQTPGQPEASPVEPYKREQEPSPVEPYKRESQRRKFSGTGAFRIWKRDRKKHESPNSAQTESACAGALGIRLAGDAWYFGQLHKKEYLGDETRSVEPEDILLAQRLMYLTSGFMFFLGAALRIIIFLNS